MAYQHLDAREWLESQRLQGCPWADELLDLLDNQDALEAHAEMTERLVIASSQTSGIDPKLNLDDLEAVGDWFCERLELLDSLETIISENVAGNDSLVGNPNIDDELRAAFESGRWLEYDL